MFLTQLPPSFILILGGLWMLFANRRLRDVLTLLLPLLTLAHIWSLGSGDTVTLPFLAYELSLVQFHPYTRIFASIFALAALGGGLFAMHTRNRRELSAAYVYAGSAIGIAFAGDLISLFIYWELMAITSTCVLWSHNTPQAQRAGLRYALMHLVGGVILMAGIAAQVYVTSVTVLPSFQFHPDEWMWTSSVFLDSEVYADFDNNLRLQSLGIWLIFIGVLVNAAAPPVTAWLTDAYPESSATGMVFLSAFTTKAAVFVLLSFFAGVELLIYIGVFMMFYGILMAILENNIRRMLAYSIVNQVGFMLAAIGIGTQMAKHGAALHAFSHILYKSLLLMSIGSVIHMTGKHKATELGGLYRSMRLTCLCGVVGALALCAMPLTTSFASKSVILSAAGREGLEWVWYAFIASSAGLSLIAGMFVWFVFFQKDSGMRPQDPPQNMRWAMVLFTLLCLIPGLFPQLLYSLLPDLLAYDPNTPAHWISQLEIVLFSGLAFFICLPLLKRTNTITIDFDWLYRRVLRWLLILLEKGANAGYTALLGAVQHVVRLCIARVVHLTAPGGIFAETKTLANTTLIVATLLAGYLLLYYYT